MARLSAYFLARIRSFGYAFRGIAVFFRTQPHAQIHLLAVGLILLVGWRTGLDAGEWCLILLCMGLVLAAEAMNTALEFLADRVSKEHHPLIAHAKDVAAGGVLLSVIFAAAVWAIIHLPKFWAMLQ